jgi:hypothetical protein
MRVKWVKFRACLVKPMEWIIGTPAPHTDARVGLNSGGMYVSGSIEAGQNSGTCQPK